jgi:hypothetical protein
MQLTFRCRRLRAALTEHQHLVLQVRNRDRYRQNMERGHGRRLVRYLGSAAALIVDDKWVSGRWLVVGGFLGLETKSALEYIRCKR